MPSWNAEIDGNPEPNLYYANVVDTSNPFGNYAILSIHDQNGTRFDKYKIGKPVDLFVVESGSEQENPTLQVNTGETFEVASGDTETFADINNSGTIEVRGTLESTGVSGTLRFPGFVADRKEKEENGNDILEVEVHSYDQFLRGETIEEDLSGKSIFNALNIIIDKYTPISWNANNVEVVDNQTLTRSFEGEKVENALLQLSYKSAAEGIGVTQDLEFFFAPIEEEPAPRDIAADELFDSDIEEDGRAAPNEATVFYNEGNSSVTVDRGDDKLERQENVGTPEPVTKSAELSRPQITDLDDARDVGERYLDERENTFLGDVWTFDLYQAEIGQVIGVNSASNDELDGDYRIAGLEYQDTTETVVTLVDRRREQDERLVNLGDAVDSIATQNVDRDAVKNVVTNTAVRCLLSVTGTAGTTDFTETRFVNTGRSKIRDGWGGDGNLDIAEIAVGNDGGNLLRNNTSLENETERVAVSETLDGSKAVEYSGTLSQNRNVREIGLFDSAGDLITRAVRETAVTTDTVSTRIAVANDPDVPKAVLSDSGQETIRDVIADNSPKLPNQYAYGDDATEPTESDTALGNELTKQSLDTILIQNAGTTTEFESITSISDTTPVKAQNDQLELLQTSFVQEGENAIEDTFTVSDGNFSGGSAARHEATNTTYSWEFTTDYTVPADNVEIWLRDEIIDDTRRTSGVFWYLNDNLLAEVDVIFKTLDWDQVTLYGSGYTGGDLEPNQTHTLRLESGDSSEIENISDYHVDVIQVADDRYTYTYDNTNDGSGGYLDGPELYPSQLVQQFDTASTRRDVTEANVTSTWNDTTNNQYIQVSNNGGSTWLPDDGTQNNTTSVDVTFGSASRNVDSRISLSRYGNRTTATPQTGFNGQAISEWNLFANPDAITAAEIDATDTQIIIPPGDLSGNTIKEGGQLASDDTLLSRSIFADIEVGQDERIISSELTEWKND